MHLSSAMKPLFRCDSSGIHLIPHTRACPYRATANSFVAHPRLSPFLMENRGLLLISMCLYEIFSQSLDILLHLLQSATHTLRLAICIQSPGKRRVLKNEVLLHSNPLANKASLAIGNGQGRGLFQHFVHHAPARNNGRPFRSRHKEGNAFRYERFQDMRSKLVHEN